MRGRYVRQTHDPGMRLDLEEHEQTEIAIERDDHPFFTNCPFEERLVAGIRADLSGLADVMALLAQPAREPPPRAAVDEKPHPETAMRSIRSWAIMRCA